MAVRPFFKVIHTSRPSEQAPNRRLRTDQRRLMANLSIDGSKFSKIDF
jgi:hypothetical protein